MKKILILTLILGLVFIGVGCGLEETADSKQQEQTQQLMTEINNQVGMPDIKEFYEKKMAKEIFELRDNSKLITYVYSQNLNGKFVYIGQCVGFGLPYSTQYTNPMQYTGVTTKKIYDVGRENTWSYEIMPQADPNGLFTPTGLSATWLMYVNPETGAQEIIYTEPSIIVTQSKLPRRLVESWSIEGINY
jgi:hypothetical protein